MLLILILFSGKIVENVDNSEIVIIQSVFSGKISIYTTPGPVLQAFGTATHYKKSSQFWFSKIKDEGRAIDQSIKIRFNDGEDFCRITCIFVIWYNMWHFLSVARPFFIQRSYIAPYKLYIPHQISGNNQYSLIIYFAIFIASSHSLLQFSDTCNQYTLNSHNWSY